MPQPLVKILHPAHTHSDNNFDPRKRPQGLHRQNSQGLLHADSTSVKKLAADSCILYIYIYTHNVYVCMYVNIYIYIYIYTHYTILSYNIIYTYRRHTSDPGWLRVSSLMSKAKHNLTARAQIQESWPQRMCLKVV